MLFRSYYAPSGQGASYGYDGDVENWIPSCPVEGNDMGYMVATPSRPLQPQQPQQPFPHGGVPGMKMVDRGYGDEPCIPLSQLHNFNPQQIRPMAPVQRPDFSGPYAPMPQRPQIQPPRFMDGQRVPVEHNGQKGFFTVDCKLDFVPLSSGGQAASVNGMIPQAQHTNPCIIDVEANNNNAVRQQEGSYAVNGTAPEVTPKVPAMVTAPAGGEVGGEWLASEGKSLRSLLQEWADRAGWRVVWNTDREYVLEAGAVFKGNFMDVSSALIRAFARANPAPQGTFYKGNRVLVINTQEAENAD